MSSEPAPTEGVTVRSKPLESSRREFLELTLTTTFLAAPFVAVASTAAPVLSPGLVEIDSLAGTDRAAEIDRLDEILRRYGSELGHVTRAG